MWCRSLMGILLFFSLGTAQGAVGDYRTALIQHFYPGEHRHTYEQLVAMLDDQEAFTQLARGFYREALGEEVDDAILEVVVEGDVMVLLDLSGHQVAAVEDLQRIWEMPDVPVGYRLGVGILLYLRTGVPEVGAQVLAVDHDLFGFFTRVDPPVGFDQVARRWLALKLAEDPLVDASTGVHAPVIAEVLIRHVQRPGLRHMAVTALPSVLEVAQRDELLAMLAIVRQLGDEELLAGFVEACHACGVQLDAGEAAVK